MSHALKTPRLTTGSRIPRASTALKQASNIPRPSLSKAGRKSIIPDNVFKSVPTTTKLKERQLPPEYQKHPIRLESKNIEEIYNYCYKIALSLFTPQYAQMFFMSALSTEKTVVVGTKRVKDSSSKVPDYSKQISKAFDFLNDMAQTKMATFIALTDFVYLYSAIVIRVSSQEQCVTKALLFVKKLLDYKLPERNAEFFVLFSALMGTQIRTPVIIGILKQVVALLPKQHSRIIKKIEKGVNENDPTIAEICIGALQIISSSNGNQQQFALSGQIELTQIEDPKTAVTTLNAIQETESLPDPAMFVRDILITMQKFQRSMSVIEAASQCLIKHIEFCCPIEHSILGQIFAVLFSTLNFSDGSIDSLDAKTSAENLINSIIEHEENTDLIISAKTAVHFLTNSAIDLLVSKFSESGFSTTELQSFHTMISEYKREKLENSINKLVEPDSIFDEMERIINDDDDLEVYPLYLRGFLQRSYYLIKRSIPQGMDEEQKEIAKEMVNDYEKMKSDKSIPESLSPESLQNQLDAIREQIPTY